MSLTLLLPSQSLVLNAYAVLIGATPGNAAYVSHQAYISNSSAAAYTSALDGIFAGTDTATLASTMLTNLGLSSVFSQADAVAYLTANAGNRVGAMINLSTLLYNYAGTNAALLTAKDAYHSEIDSSYAYSSDAVNHPQGAELAGFNGHTYTLTTAIDNLTGTAGADTFIAYINDNANSLQSHDVIAGGAGLDTLLADIGNSQNFAITPETTGIESVKLRAEARSFDTTDNNTVATSEVQVDAQRMVGVTSWESNNSRADLLIEDVRILDNQITKDITIAMVETDPGHVDFGVYFDQHSLRNLSSATSSINLQVMDTVSAAAGTAPLLNSTYGAFTFTATTNGVSQVITLASDAIQNAQTYVQLVAAFQAALDAQFGVGAATAVLGANFTVVDPASGIAVTGQSVLITANSAIAYTTPAGSGWSSQGTAPAASNFYTNYNTQATTATDLVTSKVILDDVGRGSTSGDLVIGGLSVGDTSGSQGVGRFEIEVRDNSKLETIQSTNNTLKEVTIKNGATSSFTDAYTVTVKDAGNLTVNGNSGVNGGYTGDGKGDKTDSTTVSPSSTVNANLPGTTNSVSGATSGDKAAGFTDVRLIDASTFVGKLAFTADFTDKTITKYLNLKDIQALPAGDNVAVAYTGGVNDDTMLVRLDSTAVSSNNKIVAGREDFTFNFNGGAGNDKIVVSMAQGGTATQLNGGDQAWYTNEKLNANVFIDGGDGNDTIMTPGAGDVVITAGAGDDTVYTDNTGALATAKAVGTAGTAAAAYTAAASAELAEALANAALSNATGFFHGDGTALGSVTTAAVVTGLAVIDAATPTNPLVAPAIAHGTIEGLTAAQAAAGTITLAQKVALDAAYGDTSTSGVVTPAAGIGAAATLVGAVNVVAGSYTPAQLAAGDALLATYVAAAKAADAAATATDAYVAKETALLDATQITVRAATLAVNGVDDPTTGGLNEIGSATKVADLAALHSALTSGATLAQIVTAIDTATMQGAITKGVGSESANIFAATGGATLTPVTAAAVTAVLSIIENNAALANTAAQTTLANAIAADQAAINKAAVFAAANPAADATLDGIAVVAGTLQASDSVGSLAAAAADTAAALAASKAAVDLADAQAINTALTALKAAVTSTSLDADVINALANANAAIVAAIAHDATAVGTGAVTVNPLTGHIAALTLLAGVPGGAASPTAGELLAFNTGAAGIYNADSVDSLIINNSVVVDKLAVISADAAATAATVHTAALASAAAAASGPGLATLDVAAPTAVFVFDTANQTNAYNLATMDERNLADLKSSANDSYNFANSTVKVSYKGLDASVIVAGTNAHTSDLEINQAIKKAINSDAVLSKLLLATDGPANTLVVTSLIDGVQKVADLTVSVTAATTATAADLTAAITAGVVGTGATTTDLLAAWSAAKLAFDTKGDYATQFAESGANAGNVELHGANSLSSSDNTITLGSGNDVLVLGTTVQTSLLTSSNEKVVYNAIDFGNDTIVHFAAAGLGIDQLDFTALNGSGKVAFGSLSLDKSIVVAAETLANDTAAEIAALFTDSATAINHIYVAYDAHNVGKVYQVADAAGTAAGNVTAKLIGTIDLADTGWATLTAANFA